VENMNNIGFKIPFGIETRNTSSRALLAYKTRIAVDNRTGKKCAAGPIYILAVRGKELLFWSDDEFSNQRDGERTKRKVNKKVGKDEQDCNPEQSCLLDIRFLVGM